MRARRIYTEQELRPDAQLELEAGPSHHIARVLRMGHSGKNGEEDDQAEIGDNLLEVPADPRVERRDVHVDRDGADDGRLAHGVVRAVKRTAQAIVLALCVAVVEAIG